MLERFQKGMNVRIQIPRMTWDLKAFEIGGVLALGSGLLLLLPFQLSSLFRYALYAGLGAGVLLLLGDFIAPALINSDFDESDLEDWFKTATADFHTAGGTNQVRVRELRMRSLFVTHAKIIIDRVPVESDATKTVGKRAVLLGSPFKQVYFDSFRLRDPDHPDQLLEIDDTRRGGHYIDDPRRGGDATKGPIHDVSVAIRGPAVGYLQEMFDLH